MVTPMTTATRELAPITAAGGSFYDPRLGGYMRRYINRWNVLDRPWDGIGRWEWHYKTYNGATYDNAAEAQADCEQRRAAGNLSATYSQVAQ